MMNNQVSELFDRYAAEVARQLPNKSRKDIGMEIRSMLEDSLDDRSRTQGREPDQEMAMEVLQELGSPSEVAASFAPERYLIGPSYYPAFILVLKIVLGVILVIHLVGFLVGLIRSEGASLWLEPLSELYTSAVGSFGALVLIFALMERTLPGPEGLSRDWNPRELLTVRDRDRVRRGELILKVGAGLAALVLLNFFSHKIGIYSNRNGVWNFKPILASSFTLYLPWINIRLILGLALSAAMLRQREWRPWSRYLSLALSLFGLAIVVSMFMGEAILDVTGRPNLDRLLLLTVLVPMAISLARDLLHWLRPKPYVIPLKGQGSASP